MSTSQTYFFIFLQPKVNCHKDIINCLLDYGADVNKLNYEGLSPLAACHVLFYTKHTWNDNIGETLASENLFNSVHWDTQSGSFVQRKPIYYQNKVQSKVNVNENSVQSSINSVTGILADGIPKTSDKNSKTSAGLLPGTVALRTDVNGHHTKTDTEIVCQTTEHRPRDYKDENKMNDFDISKTCPNKHIAYEERNPNKFDKNGKIIDDIKTDQNKTGDDIPNNEQDMTENCYNNYGVNQLTEPLLEHKETATSNTKYEYSEVKISKQSSDIKESIVQRSEMVDKNTFIHVFLDRAASARSKQNSSISFQNMNSSYAESYTDNRNEVYQEKNSHGSTEDNYSETEGYAAKENSAVVVTVTAPDIQESAQYSIQNAISSSLQTTNSVEDTDSQKTAEQGKQKLLTQQRYTSFISKPLRAWVSLSA
jgi:hypothetical protein